MEAQNLERRGGLHHPLVGLVVPGGARQGDNEGTGAVTPKSFSQTSPHITHIQLLLGAQYAVKEGLVPAELSLVALAGGLSLSVCHRGVGLAGQLARRGHRGGCGAEARLHGKVNLHTFFRLKGDATVGEDERERQRETRQA